MRCDPGDFPDCAVQPFRESTGRLQLLTGLRRMAGTNLNELTSDCCGPDHHISARSEPRSLQLYELVDAVYTENRRDIYALVHDEWHGTDIPGACPASPGKNRCGVLGVTFAVSHDNGDTYVQAAPPDASAAAQIPSLMSHQCGGPDEGSYPSLIDHDSTDRNNRTACQITSDRDVVRYPIQFSR
jgi:hypothetical protein